MAALIRDERWAVFASFIIFLQIKMQQCCHQQGDKTPLWVILPVALITVIVAALRFLKYWLPIGPKWSMGEMQIHERKVQTRQEGISWKVMCTKYYKSWCQENVFFMKSLLKCTCCRICKSGWIFTVRLNRLWKKSLMLAAAWGKKIMMPLGHWMWARNLNGQAESEIQWHWDTSTLMEKHFLSRG